MIPTPGKALSDLAMKLGMSIAPETVNEYAAANAGLMAMLMAALAEELERGAENRVNDIADMKTLAMQAIQAHPALPMADELAAFLEASPASLAVSDLDAVHARGSRAIIALHAWAEEHSEALDAAIWGYLEKHADRHSFSAMV